MVRLVLAAFLASCSSPAPKPAAKPLAAPAVDESGPPDEVLERLAAIEAPGATPRDVMTTGALPAIGTPLVFRLVIVKDVCYTAVVFAPNNEQLTATFVMPEPPPPPVIVATSTFSGKAAIVGGASTGCWKALSDAKVELHVKAASAGAVHFRLYGK